MIVVGCRLVPHLLPNSEENSKVVDEGSVVYPELYTMLNRNWETRYKKCILELVMSWISEIKIH
jgi:hypothetical protein